MSAPPLSRPPVDPARDIAFEILQGALQKRHPLEQTLDRLRGSFHARDLASGHRLAAGALRHRGTLTELLRAYLKKELPASVMTALLLGAVQLLFLEVPAHAAVDTAIELLKRRRLEGFAGVANAVLRKVAAEGAGMLEELDQERLDTPPWLWRAWGSRARDITAAYYREAPLDITLKPECAPPAGGTALASGSWRYPAGTKVTELAGFEEGNFWVQDAAAAMIVRLLGDVRDKKAVDLCAAPGGKSAQLASGGAHLISLERNPERADRLKRNFQRLGMESDIRIEDARIWRPESPQDIVLLDAPCSATGTFRRHPDVLWIKKPRDVKSIVFEQKALIEAAFEMLNPGGILLYAVCSLQDEEGPHRIREAVESGKWQVEPFDRGELAFLPEARTKEGCFRTHPGMWRGQGGMDGFFAARLRKTGQC